MQTMMRSTAGRRRDAIERLDSVRSAIAIAGLMGTLGFAALAAATFRGTATSNPAPAAVVDDGAARSGDDGGDSLFDQWTAQRSGGIFGGSGGLSGASGPAQVTTGGS